MKRLSLIFGLLFTGLSFMATAQVTSKDYDDCKYWELLEQLRAYEDTLASEQSLLDTLRGEYGVAVTDPGISARVYRVYRCAALLDSLTNLQDSLDFLRADPPAVQSDSISGITSSSATLHGRLLSDGGEPVTERWFKYGTSRTALNDTITAVVGVPDSIFTANLTGLTPPGTWYMAAVAKNAKGTSSGDTLQFITAAAPTMDTDSTSLRTATTATLHGKVISDGGGALTHQWFRYGLSATSLTDSIAASGAGSGTPPLTSPFSAGITGLTAATKYYFAAFGKNAAGTSAGDTLSFWTKCSVDSVSHDGHWYGVVMVGEKCWFDENLKTDQYRNGDLIPGNLDSLNWVTTLAGAQAVQDQGGPNETTNLNTYGRLYNFHAVNDSRGLCPAGWDVPTKAEWDSLYARVGGEAVAGKELKAPAPRWNGVNTNGFDVVQGGRRMPDATFAPVGGVGHAYFWTSSPNGAQAWYRYFTQFDDSYGYFNGLRNGFSVRCIQDSTTLSAPIVATDSVSSITSTGATFHGRLLSDGGHPVTERWFGYGVSASALNDTITATVGVPDSIFTAALSLSGMATGPWYVAAFAKNAKGTSSGDTLMFTIPVAPTMDTDSTSLRTSTTATLHGKVVSNGGGALTHQWFRYGLSAASLSDSVAVTGPSALASPFSAGITGLTAATKYYFAAFGKNAAGTAAGDTLSFWTKCSMDSVSYDGHWYGIVTVGDKCWFDENLKSDQYRNGDLIPGNLDSLNWVTTLAGAQAVQDQGGPNETTNLNTYGRLYNFHAVNDSRGLCPAGWDVPTKAEWDSLYARVGGEAVAGKELKAPAPRWNGVNTNGFDVVQGGRRMPDATFAPVGGVGHAYFWTSSPNGAQAWYRYFTQFDDSYGYFNGLRNGFSVRCIQDSTTLSAPIVRTDSISSITSTTATFHGRVLSDGGETVTERWFKYGTSRTALNDTITAVVGVPDSIFTANITGLTPPGTWYMVAVAKNAKGTSFGDTLQFMTAVAPTMDTDSTSLRTATTATLHGKVISDGGGDLTHQWFRYGLSATSLTDSIAASGAGSGTPPLTSPFSAGITGLTAATKYYFAAFGKNAAGTSAGDTLSFWTKCSVDSVSHNGHWYGVVMVGEKCWFDENLKTDKYNNGDLIAGNLDSLTWSTTTSGAQAVQDQGGPNETTNLNTYGRLYNFYAVEDSRGLCPTGWHVPTKAEWDSLYARVGGEAVAGKQLKAPAPRWDGLNSNGFDVLQGGRRKPDGGFEPTVGIEYAYFWTSTPNGGQAYYRYFNTYDDSYGYFNGRRNGFSVRCIED